MPSLRTAVIAVGCLATLSANADKCLTYDSWKCTSCASGNYLSDNRCYDCPSGCLACQGANSCQQCTTGTHFSGGRCISSVPSSASSTSVIGAATVLLAALLAIAA
ncbi:hypothetical protein ADEAN_000852600 [Angomonas deanei]|uniref:RanBP2-type domain-containing protein n=1 Tax=Angomonas deanei TaxID=59799 RepID=A0A7G2CPV4_9TRYP|nr:hypothetical protein ADEAN_000852600 [Angomonas deanei]